MKKILILFVVLIIMTSGVCFYSDLPTVVVKPDVQVRFTVKEKQVQLTVADERQESLGTRSVKGVGVEMTVAGI